MSRLIDADRLKIMFQFFYDEKLRNLLFEAVDNEPTAYDVEAVVRELEEQRKGEFTDEYTKFCFGKAIEIVKRGGRNECKE